MNKVVIVEDMLRGFLEEGYPLYCGDDARKIITNVRRLLEEESKKGSNIFFVADSHARDDLEFQMFPMHCVTGTAECEVVPELIRFAGTVIPKQRYSSFFNTNLEKELKRLRTDKIIVCGVCTDICVLHTVADARARDFQVEVPVDCVASFDNEAHRWALKHMEKVLGVRLTHVKEMK
jgi:nicotinamidase-related amidase